MSDLTSETVKQALAYFDDTEDTPADILFSKEMLTVLEAARLVANPNATVTRDWLGRLANGAAIAAEGRVHLDRRFLAAQADLLDAIVKELPEGDIALVALTGDTEIDDFFEHLGIKEDTGMCDLTSETVRQALSYTGMAINGIR